MKTYLIVGMLGAVALVIVAKKTNAWSYVTTACSQLTESAKEQIPTKFELERIRNEIAALDNDIGQMVRPVAEQKSAIEKLRKDIAKGQTNIEKQKRVLLDTLEELDTKPERIVRDNISYTPEQVRKQLQRNTDSLKHLERHVKTQQEILSAKEQSFLAMKEQISTVIAKKREYEVRLAELEAAEENLQLSRIGTDSKLDTTRTSTIEEAIRYVEKKQDVERHINELKKNDLVEIPLGGRKDTTPDLTAIRNYLEGRSEPAAQKTADDR
ncbi:MAG: hypothetical protein FJ303_24195 [Planctomycetes bacterium]|nr:hypothetical protein [Planctomycetota bacterium]